MKRKADSPIKGKPINKLDYITQNLPLILYALAFLLAILLFFV